MVSHLDDEYNEKIYVTFKVWWLNQNWDEIRGISYDMLIRVIVRTWKWDVFIMNLLNSIALIIT